MNSAAAPHPLPSASCGAVIGALRALVPVIAIGLLIVGLAAQAPPQRIVSTSPGVTESLFAIGVGERVVGVSIHCRYPDAVRDLPKIGTLLRPDVELIARLKPDLVIVHPGPHDVIRQLGVLGIRAVPVELGTLASVFASLRTLGLATGAGPRAERLISDLQRRLEGLRAEAALRPRRRVLIIVGRRPGTLGDLIAVGRGSYLSDLAEIAGGSNVLTDPRLPEYPRLSLETVIRLDPEVIVDAGDMGDTSDQREQKAAQTLKLWARQPQVRAAASGQIHAVTSDAFVVPGPRVVEAAEVMARWFTSSARP